MAKRFIRLKQKQPDGTDKYISLDTNNLTTALEFPLEDTISFSINNKFYTPASELITYLTEAISSTPLDIVSAIADTIDIGAKLAGANLKPRIYYAQAWQKTEPLLFTIPINLNFGWLGLYDAKAEIVDVAQLLIDASSPRMYDIEIEGDRLTSSPIVAPGPNGAEVIIESLSQLTEQLKEALGPLGMFINTEQEDRSNNLFSTNDQGDTIPEDERPLLVSIIFDSTVEQNFIADIRDSNNNLIAKFDESGDIVSLDLSRTDLTQEQLEEYAQITFKNYQTDLQNARYTNQVPESYKFNGNTLRDASLNFQEFIDVNAEQVLYNRATGSGNDHLVYVPLTDTYSSSNSTKAIENAEKNIKDQDNSPGTWTVELNGTIEINNLILDSLSYAFSNEQDDKGDPVSATLNLNFATQDIPAALFNYSGINVFNFRDIPT